VIQRKSEHYMAQCDGSISLFGQDASRFKPHEVARLDVAYVPEDRGVFPNLTVRENLVMAARRGLDDRDDWSFERVMETFPRLKERLTNLGAQLSGGEQQMLSIGRALMTHPALIVDRDYHRVLARADHALVLQKGLVVLQGTADEVANSAALSGYLGV
jgi:branched-chain amino acid transport system ATP-binding protein